MKTKNNIDELTLYSGADVIVDGINLIIHQPTIKEISILGEDNLFTILQLFNIDKSEVDIDKNTETELSNFDIFIGLVKLKQEENNRLEEIFTRFCSLVFDKYSMVIEPGKMIFTFLEQEEVKITIDKTNFDLLRTTLNQIFVIENMRDKAAKDKATTRLVEKFEKRKQLLAKKKMNEQTEENKDDQHSGLVTMAICLSVGIGISTEEILKYNYYRLINDYKKMIIKYNFETARASLLAGADIKDMPPAWL